ncbi:HM13 protein, partial [Semnornis frantzii]|nr:HM13 protein [Semnornis frantzii]
PSRHPRGHGAGLRQPRPHGAAAHLLRGAALRQLRQEQGTAAGPGQPHRTPCWGGQASPQALSLPGRPFGASRPREPIPTLRGPRPTAGPWPWRGRDPRPGSGETPPGESWLPSGLCSAPFFTVTINSSAAELLSNSSEMPETITSRDAARFPIVASCTLLGLYLFFKIFSQEYINLLLSMYFFVLGILALSHTISPMMNRFFPANFPNKQYQLLFTQGSGESKEEIVNYEFDTKDLVCLALSSVVGVWYLLRKHWIANNLFGLAFSLNGVELLHLNNVSTGCILLGGLFIYDVFWVFGTNVMVTVAKSFEAPIKLVFPQDLLEKGLEADNFAMLGLGDIVIPGIFIALLLRFDISLKKNTHTYFYTSFVAYIFGLGLTIFIMHIFKHAQPALLYLVPACIGFPLLVALAKGEVTEMFSYESSAEILPHTPRLTHFPTVSGSPASLADSMQQKLSCPRRRRQPSPSAM